MRFLGDSLLVAHFVSSPPANKQRASGSPLLALGGETNVCDDLSWTSPWQAALCCLSAAAAVLWAKRTRSLSAKYETQTPILATSVQI